MAPATRTDPLEHILLNVLGATDADDPYRQACAAGGVSNIDDLIDLTKDDLRSLTWIGTDGTSIERLATAKCNTILSIHS